MILAGDAGGTKTNLALYEKSGSDLIELKKGKYPSADYGSLEDIVKEFLKNSNQIITKACIGVPGPVINGVAVSTNLPWSLSENVLAKELDIEKFKLMNDLAVTAYSIPYLGKNDLCALYGTEQNYKNNVSVVLAPGTGLGEAIFIHNNNHSHILASEGGHVDFAPTNQLQIELLEYLSNKFGRVSYERIISGKGIINIFNFLKDKNYFEVEEFLLKSFENNDPAEIISTFAIDQSSLICIETMKIFTSVLGAQAGNLVLTLNALGGVYLGGGIPPKIVELLDKKDFIKSYLNKGRLSYLVEKTPIFIIRNSLAALIGAANYAANM